jgi:hypothetical protein
MDSALQALQARLEKVTNRLEAVEKQLASAPASSSAPSVSAGDDGSDAPFVREYDDLIKQFIQNYVQYSNKLDSTEVAEQVRIGRMLPLPI